MRRKTRLAPIANVTKENEETVMPRRLVPCTGGDKAAIVYRVENSENDIRSATLQKRDVSKFEGLVRGLVE